jgi:hypothetical protein
LRGGGDLSVVIIDGFALFQTTRQSTTTTTQQSALMTAFHFTFFTSLLTSSVFNNFAMPRDLSKPVWSAAGDHAVQLFRDLFFFKYPTGTPALVAFSDPDRPYSQYSKEGFYTVISSNSVKRLQPSKPLELD